MAGSPLNFDHFEIQTDGKGAPIILGSAGHGVTYQAVDKRLRKTVALKIIDADLVSDDNSRKRFFNEARAAAVIEHPNVARVTYLCEEDAPDCFYAMELVEGESLAHRLETNGPMAPAEALRTLQPIADALVVLGNHRLVHRDLQPANIMLTSGLNEAPTVKLIDFGLAKSIGTDAGLLDVVQTAELRSSSVFHLSPEQIHRESAVDCRSDFYSLGITLWHTLTGAPPFTGSAFEINEAHLRRALPWEKLPPLPEPVRTLLKRLLAKSPDDRPANAQEVLTLWQAALASLQAAPARKGAPSPSASPAAAEAAVKPLLHLQRVVTDPEGCALPPSSGYLATGEPAPGWFFVRSVPQALPAPVREDFLAAARAALAGPNSALLNVCDVRGDEVVSEWRAGVTAARLLASQNGELPPEIIISWLPRVAMAIEFACEHSFSRLGLATTNWIIEYLDLEPGETHAERATRPLEEWGRQRVWLDPLSGFDPLLAQASADASETQMESATEPLQQPAAYLAAFARTIHELLGGSRHARLAPLPALDEEHNILLLDAVYGRSRFSSVRSWISAFTGQRVPAAEAEAALATGDTVVPEEAPTLAPATAPATPPPPRPPRRAAPPSGARPLRPVPPAPRWHALLRHPWTRYGAVTFGLLLLVLVVLWALNLRETSHPPTVAVAPPPPEPTPQPKLGPALVPLTSAPPTAAPVEKDPETPEAATLEHPFVNSIGMKFVPVPIKGGRNDGKPVLFSMYETRIRDFRDSKFAKSTWRPEPYQTDDEHPVVKMRPKEAIGFCKWLTRQEHTSGKLPADWSYQMPTDQEWSAAAGLGEPGKDRKAATLLPWGSQWPPPPNSGNFADTSARTKNGDMPILAKYTDGFAFTAPVGQFTANAYGLYDMAGNVAEWCEVLQGGKVTGYAVRGGSWRSYRPEELYLAAKYSPDSEAQSDALGFRVMLAQSKPHEYLPPTEQTVVTRQAGAGNSPTLNASAYGAATGGNGGAAGGGSGQVSAPPPPMLSPTGGQLIPPR